MNIYWRRILNFLVGNIPKSSEDMLKGGEVIPKSSEDNPKGNEDDPKGKEDLPNEEAVADAAAEASDEDEKEPESCPIATRRLIREAMQQLRHFTEEHRLTATVAKALLAILAEITISALHGRVNTQVLEVIKRVIRHEQQRLFEDSGHAGLFEDNDRHSASDDGKSGWRENQKVADDGLPHMVHTPFAGRSSFFELADQARL